MIKFPDRFQFIKLVLNGISQIMLQENKWTGLLFLTGLIIGSWKFGAAAVLAVISGTIAAKLFNYDRKEIEAGLYGFSPALSGVAMLILFDDTPVIWFLIVLGGILSAMVQHFFISRKIPVYTFPFIVVTWVFVFVIRRYMEILPPEFTQSQFQPAGYNFLFTPTNGFGEVIFQQNIWSGIIFFIAVFISNPQAALYGLAASLTGALLSLLNGQPPEQVGLGLFGFNAVLTAIVFSGSLKIDGLWVLAGTIITVIIHNLLVNYQLLDAVGGVLTFPFVAGTWLTLLIQKLFVKIKKSG